MGGLGAASDKPAEQAERKKALAGRMLREDAAKSEALAEKEALGLKRDGKSLDSFRKRSVALGDKDADGARRAGDVSDYFLAYDAEQKRGLVRQLYRKMDPTKEWAENNYYHLPIDQQTPALVPVSPFWLDYAKNLSWDPRKEIQRQESQNERRQRCEQTRLGGTRL